MTLDDDTFTRFRPARVFESVPPSSALESKYSSTIVSPVTSVDIEPVDAEFAVTAHGKANLLTLFNARLGVAIQRIPHVAGEGGVLLAKFTRNNLDSTVLVAPRVSYTDTLSYAIRLYSLLRNETIGTFSGHGDQVSCLLQSPSDGTFLSSDNSGEVRLWDTRGIVPCVGKLRTLQAANQDTTSATTQVAFSADGASFFCVNSASGRMRLTQFDMRKLASGPTKTIMLASTTTQAIGTDTCVDLKASPDGKMLVTTMDSDSLSAFDVEGKLIYENNCTSNKSSTAMASFSADGKYLVVQGLAGALVFGASDGHFVCNLESGSSCSVSRICCFSPKTELLITSGEDATVFWSE